MACSDVASNISQALPNGSSGPATLSYVTGGVDTAALYDRFTFAEWAGANTRPLFGST